MVTCMSLLIGVQRQDVADLCYADTDLWGCKLMQVMTSVSAYSPSRLCQRSIDWPHLAAGL